MSFPKPAFTASEPITLDPPPRPFAGLAQHASSVAATVLPPALTLLAILTVWQLLCGDSYEGLPSPSRIWSESRELIVDPFFDRGGIDKGLFWHLSASLQRVALGYSLAAIAGIAASIILFVQLGISSWQILRDKAAQAGVSG